MSAVAKEEIVFVKGCANESTATMMGMALVIWWAFKRFRLLELPVPQTQLFHRSATVGMNDEESTPWIIRKYNDISRNGGSEILFGSQSLDRNCAGVPRIQYIE
jgi:hypothetical protein